MPTAGVAEPHHEGEDERHAEFGGRGVERERRDLETEQVEGVLGVRRQRDVADHVREQMRGRKIVPMKGTTSPYISRSMFASRWLTFMAGRSSRRASATLFASAACACDVEHRHAGEERGGEEVATALLIERSIPAMWMSIQAGVRNSSTGLNSSFLPDEPGQRVQQTHEGHDDAESGKDLERPSS